MLSLIAREGSISDASLGTGLMQFYNKCELFEFPSPIPEPWRFLISSVASQFSRQGDDLSDNLGIMPVPEPFRPVIPFGIGVQDQSVVLKAAKLAPIVSVSPQQQVDRLLP